MKNFKLFEKPWEHGRTLRRVGMVLVMCLIAIPQLWAWYVPGNLSGSMRDNVTANNMGGDHKITFFAVPAGTYKLQLTNGSNWSGNSCVKTVSGCTKGTDGTYATITISAAKNVTVEIEDAANWKVKVTATDPCTYIKYGWGGGTWNWSQGMNPYGDGKYACVGQYSGGKDFSYQVSTDEEHYNDGKSNVTVDDGGVSLTTTDNCIFIYDVTESRENPKLTIKRCSQVGPTNYVYFDNTESNWSGTYVYFMIGRPVNISNPYLATYRMTAVGNTNLYRYIHTSGTWTDADYYAVGERASSAYSSGNNGWTVVPANFQHWSAPYTSIYNMENTHYYMISKTSGDNNTAITIAEKGTALSSLNNLTVGYKYHLNGSDMSSGNTPAQISMVTYSFSNCSTAVANTTQTISANTSGTYTKSQSSAAYRGKVMLTMSNLQDGYIFLGWYEGDTQKSSAASYTFYPKDNTTITAKFAYKWNINGGADKSGDEMGDWDRYNGMEYTGTSNTYSVTIPLAASTTYDFKVVNRVDDVEGNNVWWGKTTANATFTRSMLTSAVNLTNSGGAGYNMRITTDVAGDYTFTYIHDGTDANKRILVKYPCATAGKQLFKFETKSSGLGTGNVCSSSGKDYVMSTENALSALAGGSLTARAENSNNRLQYAGNAFKFNNGDRGVLRIDLDCPLQTGDVIRYINSSSDASYNVYVRKTSTTTSLNQLTLAGNNPTVAEVVVTSAFNGESTIYIVRGGADGALISHVEIIRPYVVTLDASTNGGQVNGNNTEVHYMLASESLVLPHADKTNYRFKGWYTTYNGSTSPSNPYTPTANATLYAQFEDCPSSDATIYKFQLKTTLTNGAAFGGATGDYETDVTNCLSTLIGGTLLTHQYSSNLTIVSKSKFQFGSNNEYLKVDLDCALEAGDKFVTTISNDELCVTTSSTRDNTYKLYTGTELAADIPAAFVGAKTLYIWRDGTDPQISYFEVYRPAKYTITYNKGTADGASGDSFTGTKIDDVNYTLSDDATAFTREGYTYDGWSESEDGSTQDYAFGGTYSTDADITLYPYWVADASTYSITYYCNSATSGCPSNATEQTALPNPLPTGITKNGYTFGGWYTDEDCTVAAVAGDDLSDDADLYAKWTCTTPTIGTNPSDATVCKDATKPALTVAASANGGTLSYQWYSNTTKSTSDATLLTDSTKAKMYAPTGTAGKMYYFCVVTNSTGTCSTIATSDIATVTVNAPVAISSHPSSVANAVVGSASTLTVVATGTSLTYQWYTCAADGTSASAISSGTNASAVTATLSITPSSAGTTYYKCVVSGSCGSDQTSSVASILAKNNISPSLTYASTVAVGSTINPTLSGAGDGSVTYSLNSVTPANSLSINSSTGVVTGEIAGGTATVTATITAGDDYWGGSATSGTITVPYVITHSAPSNGSYTIKVGTADAVSTNANSLSGTSITLTATPSSGYVFDHWTTSGTSVTLSNANVSPATFTMPAGNVTVNAVFKATPNVYYYKDATHFTAPSTYKNPEGNAPSNTTDETLALADPWTISQSVAGVTSVVVNDGKWDNKSGTDYKWATAYIKIPSGGDKDNSNVTFTIASGYEATIKMKIGSWSDTPGITLKKLSGGSLGDALSKTGSIGGHATTENAFNELTWSSLSEGIYVLTVTSKNCYISEIDIQTESLGYAITKSASNGTISTKVSGSEVTSAAEGATVTITATPETGYHFTSWTVTETESGNPVSVVASRTTPTTFTMPAAAVTVDAGFELTSHRITLSSAFKGDYTVQVDGGGATRFSTYATYGQTITLHTTRTSTNEYVWSTWGVTMTETGDPVAVTLSTDSTFTMPDGPVTIRPIYGKLYTVSFNTNGGSSAPGDIKQTTVGGTITMPSAPTKSGCTFAGWVIGSETYAAGSTSYVPTDDVTAIAAWKATCAGGGGSDTNITIFDGTISTNPAPNATDGTSGLTYKKGKEYTDATTGFKHKLVDIKDALVDVSEVSFTNKGSYVNAIKWGGSSTQYFAQFVVPSGYTASVTITYVLTSGATKYIGFGTSNSAMPNGSNFDTNVAITSNNAVGSYTFSSLSSGTYYLMCSGGDKFYVLGLSATVTSSGSCNYVTYNGNGATGGITNDPTAYDNDAAVTVLANGFSRPGYEFDGWNTKADGNGTSIAAASSLTITKDTTLYAQWTPVTLYFNGSGSGTDYDWFNKVNWTVSGGDPGCVPTIAHDVVLEKQTRLYGQEVSGEGNHAKAKSIKIDKSTDARKNIRMEIWSYCSMIVAQGITAKHIGDADFGATTFEDVRIETSILGNAGLVCGSASSNTEVTYIFRTKAFMVIVNEGGKNKKYYRNQYFGIPFTTIDGDQYWGSILYKYDDNNDVWMAAPTDGEGKLTLAPFTAYNLIRKVESGEEFTLKGTLNLPGTGAGKTRTLTCGWRAEDTGSTIDATKTYQDFMFANSWSAPIDISSMTASDCSGTDGEDLVHTIYIFNTGYEVGGVKQVGDEDGQWSAFPFESSAYMEGAVIPATQAFLVTSKKGSTGATLTLDYKKHVYDPAVKAGQTNTYATRAPRRNRVEYDAPIKLKMVVKTDSLVLDKLYMFERLDFTESFDNGWDGTKIEGVTTVPMLYAVQGNSKMAVSAVPELDGEEIVFRAGTKSNVYTFEFEYEEDAYPIYLYDRDTEEFTLIENKATYTFMTEDTEEHARFVLTRSKSPQIATGFIDAVPSDQEVDTSVRKLIQNNHVYILRGGHVYSIDGALVK